MPSAIGSLQSQIDTAIRNQIEAFFKQQLDAFKAQPPSQHSGIGALLSAFLKEQLAAYKKQLPNQPNGVGGTIGRQTIDERERGATDLVDFLCGVPRVEGAHIRKARRRRQ
jgi:hypothetical protein